LHGVGVGRADASVHGRRQFASGLFTRERLKTRRIASNPLRPSGRLTSKWSVEIPDASLSYTIALVFALIGLSLAGSADRDMPGVGTFTYCGSPVVTAAPDLVVVDSE
jgi:hypothetical protein